MLKYKILFFLILTRIFADECTLHMAYKTINKPPYVFENNKGIYIDLFKKAAEDIGCTLTLTRKPKQRIIEDLKSGEIDIYPAFGVTKERLKFVHHLKTYIPHYQVLITKNNIPDITDLKQLKELNLTSVVEKIRFSYLKGLCNNEYKTSKLDTNKAILLILNKRADVIISPLLVARYYINKYHYKNLKIHYNLFKDKTENHLFGFSKKSKYIKEIPNPNFDKSKKITINNYPFLLDKKCTAYRLQTTLKKLKQNGYIKYLFEKYAGNE